jgi:RND family efflux transporter MFP subunit
MLLIAVAIGVVSGVSIGCGGSSEGSSTGASSGNTTQLITVRYGNLTSTISASGSLVYSTSRQLTFDSAGTVAAVYVEKDDTVKKGDVLARLDSESIESLEGAVARARINLRDAEEALENAQNPYSESDIADARQAVNQAQTQLTDAQERGPIQIANAEYALYKAEKSYSNSITQFMDNKISLEELEKAERDWEIAKLDLEIVKVNVEKAVSDAEKKLATAEETLQEALAGADSLEVALKQSELDSAGAALDNALEQLESAKEGYPVVAPFDGVVADVNVNPGGEVNANTVIIELIDPSAFEMSAIVDEIDVAQLRLGQKATVTLDALSDLELSGNVSSISAFAQSQSGVVSYPISISVATPAKNVKLLEGMSATATIEVNLASNALLIPDAAIVGTSNRPVVMVMVDGQQQPRMVTLGATDGVRTEVVSGLKEGDVVVVNAATSGTSPGTSPIGTPGGNFPGGFPGGDFPGGDFPRQ